MYKEDAGDGAATGNIFCSGEQITERNVTTKQARRTLATNTNAIRRRRRDDRVPPRMTPRPFLIARSLARRKESNEASTNATVIDIRPAEEKGQRKGMDGGGDPCMLNVLKEQ